MAYNLLSAAIATGAGSGVRPPYKGRKQFQAFGTTTASTGAATVQIQGSNDNTNWDLIGSISLTLGTTATSDGFQAQDAYDFHRANVTTLTGTGASVSVTVGV